MSKWSKRRSPPIVYERARKPLQSLPVLDRNLVRNAGKELLEACTILLAQIRPQGGNTTITADEGHQFLRVTLVVLNKHLGADWVKEHLVEHWLSAPLVELVGQYADEEWIRQYCRAAIAVIRDNTREPPKYRGEEAEYDQPGRVGRECA